MKSIVIFEINTFEYVKVKNQKILILGPVHVGYNLKNLLLHLKSALLSFWNFRGSCKNKNS